MELRDFIVTPILIIVLYTLAFIIRPLVTDDVNRQYFIPALSVRIFGALAVGFIYQFYYHGGDTFNYHTHGSRHIWEAFMDSPEKGFKMIFGNVNDQTEIYKYASRIPFLHDHSAYTIIRIAGFIDVLTFSAYSATATIFAIMSFAGSWMLFQTFYLDRPHLMRSIALATLFIPSVFFWGSGLLKDTITLAALGCSTYLIRRIFIDRKTNVIGVLILLGCFYIIYSIKIYILLCYLPAILLWVYASKLKSVKSLVLKLLLLPVVIILIGVSGYLAIDQVGKDDSRYNLNQIGATAQITAYDIAYQTGKDAGSTYSLGELDGSLSGMLKLAPQAINASLFRPYLWEVRNPLMLMSALESVALLILTIYVFFKSLGTLSKTFMSPDVLFCLVFSITFAFSVGISTFNFGTLSRYKIPLLPFYALALIFIYDQAKSSKKFSEFDDTE